ncbi:trace amine-associated receptor 4-like [Protopterus annectens]|uniref:trace amine-associated receptor 4-like n=1 Tax=Protopterus annectens TaxID=7888 RepID=UPI001CFBF04F|nr:trace amine-associated receptor 4-like [Protopterus annectens]
MNKTASQNLTEVQYCFPSSIEGSCIKTTLLTAVSFMLYTLLAALIIVVICGNLVVIISVSHFRQLHTPTNFLTLSLAVTDFFVGSLILPFSMIRSIEACWYFGSTFCKIHSVLDSAFTSISVLHLCFIAIDRYYAICDPLQYASKITTSVTAVFLSVCWVVPTCFSFGLVLFGQNTDEPLLTTLFCEGLCVVIFDKTWALITPLVVLFTPLILMIVIYSKIFAVARNHSAAINSMGPKITSTTETKAAKTLGLITGVFILCWLPFSVVFVVNSFFNVSADLDWWLLVHLHTASTHLFIVNTVYEVDSGLCDSDVFAVDPESGNVEVLPPDVGVLVASDDDDGDEQAESGGAENQSDTEIVTLTPPAHASDTVSIAMHNHDTSTSDIAQVYDALGNNKLYYFCNSTSLHRTGRGHNGEGLGAQTSSFGKVLCRIAKMMPGLALTQTADIGDSDNSSEGED